MFSYAAVIAASNMARKRNESIASNATKKKDRINDTKIVKNVTVLYEDGSSRTVKHGIVVDVLSDKQLMLDYANCTDEHFLLIFRTLKQLAKKIQKVTKIGDILMPRFDLNSEIEASYKIPDELPVLKDSNNKSNSLKSYARELKELACSLYEDVVGAPSDEKALEKFRAFYKDADALRKDFSYDHELRTPGESTEGHTKYLQGVDVPIMVNSVWETESHCIPSPVCEMHVGQVNGEEVLLITPEHISLPEYDDFDNA